jgi:uncharacterized protein
LFYVAGPAALSPGEIAANQARAVRNRAVTQIGSLRQLKTGAEAGDVLAQYELATLLDPHHNRESKLIPQDPSAAAQWYAKAVAANPDAAFSLGALYATGEGVDQNLARSAALAEQAAAAGNSHAQLAAARLYARCDLPRDPARAGRWLIKSAEQGNPAAAAALAVGYALGEGVPRDYALAARTLRRPAATPSPADAESAMVADAYLVGQALPPANTSARPCASPAPASDVLAAVLPDAGRGDSNAAYVAGRIYTGLLPAPPDYPQAVRWFTAAANHGDPNSAYALGQLYRDGTGVKRDRVKAAEWFRIAADKRDPAAAFELANLYNTGIRADQDPPDYAQAVRWYRAAADLGYAPAWTALGIHAELGYGVSRDRVQAAQWYRKAADQNDAEALDSLGKLYQNGAGVPRDLAEAARLFTRALEAGNQGAGCDLAYLYLQSLAAPPDGIDRYVEAYKWYDIVFNRCRNRERCPAGAADSGMQAAGQHLDPARIEMARKLAVAWLDAHGDN